MTHYLGWVGTVSGYLSFLVIGVPLCPGEYIPWSHILALISWIADAGTAKGAVRMIYLLLHVVQLSSSYSMYLLDTHDLSSIHVLALRW
jgi:hypothetical protein